MSDFLDKRPKHKKIQHKKKKTRRGRKQPRTKTTTMDSQGPEQEQMVINLSKTFLAPDCVCYLKDFLSLLLTTQMSLIPRWIYLHSTEASTSKFGITKIIREMIIQPKDLPLDQNHTLCLQFRMWLWLLLQKKVDFDIERLFQSSNQRIRENLNKSQKLAIDHLAKNESTIIKPADKWGAVVVMDKDKYVEEALRQLNNHDYYQRLLSNPIDNTKERLKELLLTAKDTGWISKQEHDFLLCQYPRIPTFYMLPKVHNSRDSPPGRPIISPNSSLTEPASQFIDFHIKPLAQQLPS